MTERDVIRESHPGTGESVSPESNSHINRYRTTKTAERIIPVLSFSLVTLSPPSLSASPASSSLLSPEP